MCACVHVRACVHVHVCVCVCVRARARVCVCVLYLLYREETNHCVDRTVLVPNVNPFNTSVTCTLPFISGEFCYGDSTTYSVPRLVLAYA